MSMHLLNAKAYVLAEIVTLVVHSTAAQRLPPWVIVDKKEICLSFCNPNTIYMEIWLRVYVQCF